MTDRKSLWLETLEPLNYECYACGTHYEFAAPICPGCKAVMSGVMTEPGHSVRLLRAQEEYARVKTTKTVTLPNNPPDETGVNGEFGDSAYGDMLRNT